MARLSRSVRPWVVAVAAAAVPLSLLLALLAMPLAFQEQAPASAAAPAPRASVAARAQPASPTAVHAALGRAAEALRAGDRAAWDAALPATGPAAGHGVTALYRRLHGLPWTSLALHADAIPGRPGRYDVRVTGALAGVGPADRVLAERVLIFRSAGAGAVVAGDVTPPALTRRNLMAFQRPVAVRRPGCVVISEQSWRPQAVKVAEACGPARARLASFGITPGAPVFVYLYSSRAQLAAALDGGPAERRIQFFSHVAERRSGKKTTRDVGVLAPALAGQGQWVPLMLAHELTHAYTASWFAKAKQAPTLLEEGLAVMVEGGRTYQPLRDRLARGRHLPLLTDLSSQSLWEGKSMDRVTLAYLGGGALVTYVLHRWGIAEVRRFVTAVADSDLSAKGIDTATRGSLGIGWSELVSDVERSVRTLP